MKLNFEVVPARELEDGDVFYCTPDIELNDFGQDFMITGTDQIFIKDDYFDEDDEGNHAVLVNGGWNIWFKPDDKVVRLFHYSSFIRVIEMVMEGNPDMELGPNDNSTIIENLKRDNLLPDVDLLANLKKDWLDEGMEGKDNDDEGEEDDDEELPF